MVSPVCGRCKHRARNEALTADGRFRERPPAPESNQILTILLALAFRYRQALAMRVRLDWHVRMMSSDSATTGAAAPLKTIKI